MRSPYGPARRPVLRRVPPAHCREDAIAVRSCTSPRPPPSSARTLPRRCDRRTVLHVAPSSAEFRPHTAAKMRSPSRPRPPLRPGRRRLCIARTRAARHQMSVTACSRGTTRRRSRPRLASQSWPRPPGCPAATPPQSSPLSARSTCRAAPCAPSARAARPGAGAC